MMLKRLVLGAALVLMTACAGNAPPTLTPVGVRAWQGNEAVVALNTVQHAAIDLNAAETCAPAVAPLPPVCSPIVSTANTRLVIDLFTIARTTMKAFPDGWRATALSALDQATAKLDAAGRTKLAAYLTAARATIAAIP